MSRINNCIAFFKHQPFALAFFLLLFFALLLNLTIYKDFSITNDEPMHHVHGKVILDYYLGTDSTAALSPLDSNGKIIITHLPKRDPKIRGMNFFGGFPDLVVAVFIRMFPDADEYYLRHLITSFWGLLALLFAGILAKTISGWRAAFLAALILWLSPRFFGHSFYNPKDLPFATSYLIGLYLIVKITQALPRFNWKAISIFILVCGISIAIRVSGMLLIACFALSVFMWWLMESYQNKFSPNQFLRALYLLIFVIVISVAGFYATTLFWPFASKQTTALFSILSRLSNFEGFNAYELYFGKRYASADNPWHYGFVWTFITLPLTYLSGLLCLGFLFSKHIESGNIQLKNLFIALLLFAALFPPIYVIIRQSVLYNEARHILFIVPPFAVLAAIGFNRLFTYLQKTVFLYLGIGLFAVFTIEPALWMYRNHPLQGLYFSPIIGGEDGAFKKFDFDYWGFSAKPALEWVAENLTTTDAGPIRLRKFYGEHLILSHFIQSSYPNIFLVNDYRPENWDYEIRFTVEGKWDSTLLNRWPLPETIHEIKVDNTPVCAIIKNPHLNRLNELNEKLNSSENFAELVNTGLEFYKLGDYHRSIKSTLKAISINPNNAIAYNNLCSSYNQLKMYEKAEKAGLKAVSLDTANLLARSNLAMSRQGLNYLKANPRTSNDFLNLSYFNYLQNDIEESINMCFEALKLDPSNPLTYNNLCSFYNILGEFEKARIACEKAIALDPDYVQAKNNLKVSLEEIEKAKNLPRK